MMVVRCLLSMVLALALCGCVGIGGKYRKPHNRVIRIYADPALATRADYEAAAMARLHNRGRTALGLDVRPSRSARGSYLDFKAALLWTPSDAFTSHYFDSSTKVRTNVEQKLGPPVVSSGDSAYWT